jgi:hypothetical protein
VPWSFSVSESPDPVVPHIHFKDRPSVRCRQGHRDASGQGPGRRPADDHRQGHQDGEGEDEKAKTLKLKIAPAAKAKARLAANGSFRVKVKATYQPTSGISVSKTKSLVLKLR